MCPANLAIISGRIVPQARLSLRHVQRILEAMHCGMDKIITVVCYVTNISYVQTAQREFEASRALKEVIGHTTLKHMKTSNSQFNEFLCCFLFKRPFMNVLNYYCTRDKLGSM